MSKSRGAIVFTGISILCIAASYRKYIDTKNILMILLDVMIVLAVLYLLPPTRSLILSVIAPERGVGREVMWRTAWEFYLESNPLIGHGLGTQIERVMIERANLNYSTHNMYLYVLIMGGISMIFFYGLSIWILLRRGKYRHHYLIPLLIGWVVYDFFELAGTPFDYWHLSNMFTLCLFFIPSALSHGHHSDIGLALNGTMTISPIEGSTLTFKCKEKMTVYIEGHDMQLVKQYGDYREYLHVNTLEIPENFQFQISMVGSGIMETDTQIIPYIAPFD